MRDMFDETFGIERLKKLTQINYKYYFIHLSYNAEFDSKKEKKLEKH